MRGPLLSFVLVVSTGSTAPLMAQQQRAVEVDSSIVQSDSSRAESEPAPVRSGDSTLVIDTLGGSSDLEEKQVYLPPPQFAHDVYFQNYVSTFSSSMSETKGDLPGLMGLEGDGLSDELPGVLFSRNGLPYQAAEYSWLGGDGQVLGIGSNGTSWEAEPLGFPAWSAHDPVMMPGPSDSVFVIPVPLLDYTSSRLDFWRDFRLPDSALAEARHAHGPDGFSYTGGRFRSRAGSRGAFDGQVYRVFSDGNVGDAAFDGHNLDIQFRRYVGTYPARISFSPEQGRTVQYVQMAVYL